jgi:AcrR family transcriptional regulator
MRIDGRVSRAERQRKARRAEVMEVARRLFSEKGYHGTSIDDLIEAAGIARGTFYLYFESKRAIFDELLNELFETLAQAVKRIETGPGAKPPVEQMNATVDLVFKTLLEKRAIARILLREAVGIDADFDRKLHDFYGRIEALLMSAIETGIGMGIVRRCEPKLVARCILGACKETVLYVFVENDPDRIDVQKAGREMIAFTLKGLFT